DLLGAAGRSDHAGDSRHGDDRRALDRARPLRPPADRGRHDPAMGPRPAMTVLGRLALAVQKRFGRQRLRKILLGAIPFVVLAGLWQLNTVYRWLAPIHMPAPSTVWHAAFSLQEGCPGLLDVIRQHPGCVLTNHVVSSLGRVALSLV